MLPKAKKLQEIANEETTTEFLQEVVEPEVRIPVEPEVLMEEKKQRVIIKPGRLTED